MSKPRIAVPETAESGEIIEIKTLISHPMETGFRVDSVGRIIPRNIMTKFECLYGGEEVFRMDLHPGIAANPFISFFTRATQSGELEFRWTDQNGQITVEKRSITVTNA